MEFFAEARAQIDRETLQGLPFQRFTRLCPSFLWIQPDAGLDQGQVFCVWGEFTLQRQLIQEGVRFSLPECPNGLAWTLTQEETTPDRVLIHCTINRRHHEPDFVESLQDFVRQWAEGLEAAFPFQELSTTAPPPQGRDGKAAPGTPAPAPSPL